MHDKLKRSFWLFMVVLFIITGLGVGVYAFWANTHPDNNFIQCAMEGKVPNQQPANGKVRGTKLADFSPLGKKKLNYVSCIDFKLGSGAQITSENQTVTFKYVGALAATGEIFDDSFDGGQALTTALTPDSIIAGLGSGMLGMKVGGMRRILIPAYYAYQDQPRAGIPANSDLVFDIQLVNIK